MTLDGGEFLRRFLLHTLPRGFQRIRSYGLLANRVRRDRLARCRGLLDMPAPPEPSEAAVKAVTLRCPACRQGHLHIVDGFDVVPAGRAPPMPERGRAA